MNVALRTGLGRHRLLFDKTPVPLLSDAEPAVSVYVDNGRIMSTQSGKANALRRQLDRKLGEVALPTHEAEAEQTTWQCWKCACTTQSSADQGELGG